MVSSRRALGANQVLIDDGTIAVRLRDIARAGVDGAVELVNVNVLKDTLRAVRPGGGLYLLAFALRWVFSSGDRTAESQSAGTALMLVIQVGRVGLEPTTGRL